MRWLPCKKRRRLNNEEMKRDSRCLRPDPNRNKFSRDRGKQLVKQGWGVYPIQGIRMAGLTFERHQRGEDQYLVRRGKKDVEAVKIEVA